MGIIERLLGQVEFSDEDIYDEEDAETPILWWSGRNKKRENTDVFIKSVESYNDARLVLEKIKEGSVCIIKFDLYKVTDAQGMLNFISGGIYALDGGIKEVEKAVFIASKDAAEIELGFIGYKN